MRIFQKGNGMKMQKRQFRIGEFAKHLDVERFVIRFWEKEFKLKTDRSTGGQRFYNEDDLAIFEMIKELLYKKGFTIAGAKQQISTYSEQKVIASKKTDMNYTAQEVVELQRNFEKQKSVLIDQLLILQKKLQKLQTLL